MCHRAARLGKAVHRSELYRVRKYHFKRTWYFQIDDHNLQLLDVTERPSEVFS